MAVAVGVIFGISKLVPGLRFAILMVIWGVLVIPAFVCLGITLRHAIRGVKLRRAERLDGQSDWGGRLGAFVDVHPYVVLSMVVGTALMYATIWAVVENK
jgi:hypothetical protein